MTGSFRVRFIVFLTILLLAIPSMPVSQMSANTVHEDFASNFKNGTINHTIPDADGLSLSRDKTATDTWTLLNDGEPPWLVEPVFEFDNINKEFLVFGLYPNYNQAGETWLYDPTEDLWIKPYPLDEPLSYDNMNPNVINPHTSIFDSVSGEILLFGGSPGNENWGYNISRNTWTNRTPTSTPPIRLWHAMALDSSKNEAVLFGGYSPDGSYLNDTWILNLSTNSWTNRTPMYSPPGRSNSSMAFDSVNGVIILFGGLTTSGIKNDTWIYDPGQNKWTQEYPIASPAARQLHRTAFHIAKGELILFGGAGSAVPFWNAPTDCMNDTWSYNLTTNTWINMTPSDAPKPRMLHSMSYNPLSGEILLLFGTQGGYYSESTYYLDMWKYNYSANSWHIRTPKEPSGRLSSSMAYNQDSGECILFGGYNGLYFLNDTWTYNLTAKRWTLKYPSNSPTPRSLDAIAYDDRMKEAVLFGALEPYVSIINETWVYNFSTNNWLNKEPLISPSYYDGDIVYACKTGEMVFFGGIDHWNYPPSCHNETWRYNLSTNTWTNWSNVNSPPARHSNQMVYLGSSDEILLFGGYNSSELLNDTWIYNITTNIWTKINTITAPCGRGQFGMAYDSTKNEVILLAGDTGGISWDSWRFNLTSKNWTKISDVALSHNLCGHNVVYDENLEMIISFGGGGFRYACLSPEIGQYFDTGEVWAFNYWRYSRTGEYTSPAFDTGTGVHFQTINWSADIPEGTGLQFQLRTANTNASLQTKQFVGPDGTNKTFYNVSGQTISDIHNGDRWIQHRAYLNTTYDLVSPKLKSVVITYNIAPQMPILGAPANGQWTNDTRPTFGWTATDNDSAISGFEWQMDGSPQFDSLDYTSGQVVSTDLTYKPELPLADGTWYWRVRTLDSDGDWGPFSGSRLLRVDTEPPEPFQPVADPAGWTNGSIKLTFNTTDSAVGMGHYDVEIDGISQGNQTSPYTLPLLSDGEHNITVKAFDLLWNCISASVRIYQDKTPPLAFTPTAEPPGWTNASPRIYFNTSDETSGMDRYELGLDGGSRAEQASPYILPELNDGQHNVTVRAIDKAGNSKDARVSVFIDKSRPINFTITRDYTGWTNKDPTLTFQALDNMSSLDHYEVKVPGGNFTVQTSPYRVPNFTDGRHNITIRAYDKASNYAEANIELFIDRTPPANFTPAASPATWTNQDPNITFSTVDNTSGISRYEVGLAGGNLSTRTSPFRFTNLSDGRYQVIVRAFDNAGNYAEGTVKIYFDKTPPSQISLRINNDKKSTDKMKVTLSIQATDSISSLGSVCFSNDGESYSDWEPFANSKEWNLSNDQGSRTVYLKVRDQAGNVADPVLATINYSPSATGGNPLLMPAILLLILIVVAAAAVVGWRASKRKKPDAVPEESTTTGPEEMPPGPVEEETPLAKPEKEAKPLPAEILTEAPIAPPKEAAREETRLIAPSVSEKPAEAPLAKAQPVQVAPAVTIPAIPVAVAVASEGFTVEDIFLIYRDGRLIQHATRRLKADMDVEVVTSMLTAVQEFIKESFGKAEGQELGSMEFGDSKILLQKGKYVVLAAVITGPEAPGFRDELKFAVTNIEGEFGAVLPDWNGVIASLAGTKKFLTSLGSYQPGASAPAKAKEEITLKGELEFYQGFVRLKVAVKNGMATNLTRTTFNLVYNDKALRLDHVEPDYERKGDQVMLGIVDPAEKKTVAFYLDPQICTESHIEGVLTFKDARGNLSTLMMPRKLASVVCPILYTEENINTAMLKRMAVDELDKKDAKVFNIPSGITVQKAFELGKAAVQHHDLRHVREFCEKEPYIGEAWYYGKAKGRDEKLVVRVRALAEQQVLEFHVASTSTLMLTGMLAELKSDLNDELSTKQVKGRMEQVTDAKKVDALGSIMSLLEKASEIESESLETDIQR